MIQFNESWLGIRCYGIYMESLGLTDMIEEDMGALFCGTLEPTIFESESLTYTLII